jgi:peptidoglycan/LPS O-acetylase OafA/YrhL
MLRLARLKADPQSGRDPALDGVRAIACLMVYFYHRGVDLRHPPLVVEGFTGVTFFFVLSGYLMFGPFAEAMLGNRPFPAWKSYTIRRSTRIYPPYLACLIVYTAVRFAMERFRPGGTNSPPPGAENFASHALLIFNYGDRRDFFSICGVFWSLAIEAQFYVVLPIACALAARLGAGDRRSVAAFVLAFGSIGPLSRAVEFHYFVGHHLPDGLPRFVAVTSYLDLFAAGMALAVFPHYRADEPHRAGHPATRWLILGLGVAGFLAAENWSLATTSRTGGDWQTSGSFAYTTFYPAASSAAAGLILLALVTRREASAWPLTWGPVVRVGEISYSIYLYHMLVQVGMSLVLKPDLRYPGPWEGSITAAIALAPTLVASAIAYHVVERPALAWGLRYSSHKGAARRAFDDTKLSGNS